MNNMFKLAVLPGDGIGPEVMRQALKILNKIKKYLNKKIIINTYQVGGTAINTFGNALPEETLHGCEESDAILFGSIGGPEWDYLPLEKRPEQGSLLKLRKHFNLFANLRPAYIYDNLYSLSPLKNIIIRKGFDVVCVRELTGGIYFGEPKGVQYQPNNTYAFDTEIYYEYEIERIAKIAFNLAVKRKKKICSIDKANVLYTSVLWRRVINKISQMYDEVTLQHMYIDNAVMQLMKNPSQFDVILCPNLFGDIISDQCAMITGSIGNLPSASLNNKNFGLYEPAGGSAPNIAGKNIANPIAQILSLSMLIEYSLQNSVVAQKINNAIIQTLAQGYRTKDLVNQNTQLLNIVTTEEMGTLITQNII
ncbi:3-isopropylmalate dehydrogenase [Enterobacteriaceae endosymbiont of Macroplea appendiculata]|uniref:3-isopropylmalate dehydrogenase n=1 Tax=Enterobacteriaceae endosymbiont of Macroplea appendiculata TaxID=2675790 RepID=UPI001448B427|nr:3-isopropylmalate dehydrogenase [Enterobacteriaceae endosymbiont of Macroplea appendiculata]QJC30676.1 3-isopropylmalate dehydrogenase [Enterobacteriaceae endosymbiont of Macroplea appendiculata]